MPVDCKQCPEHGALAKEIEFVNEELKEHKTSLSKLTQQLGDIKMELLKLENREKILLGIFALLGTLVSSLGSIIGCIATAYWK